MEDIWKKIYNNSDDKRLYLRKSWFSDWEILDTSETERKSNVLYEYVEEGSDKAAVLPYYVMKKGPFRFTNLAGLGYLSRGIPNTGSNAALIEKMFAKIASIKGVTGYQFGPVESYDAFQNDLNAYFKKQGWYVYEKSYGVDLGKPVPASFDEYMQQFSSKRRSNVRGLYNRIKKIGDVDIVSYTGETKERWEEIFKEIEIIEKGSWVATQGDPRFLGTKRQEFWNRLMEDEWFSKHMTAIVLYLDSKPIAHNIILDTGELRIGLDTSYVKEMAKYNPGTILDFESVKNAIENNIKYISTGYGGDAHKMAWGAVYWEDIMEYTALPPTLLGRLAYSYLWLGHFFEYHGLQGILNKLTFGLIKHSKAD